MAIGELSWKTLLFLISLLGVILINVYLFLPSTTDQVSQGTGQVASDVYARVAPDIHASIESQIAALDKEAIEESLRNLWGVEMYYWPGSPESGYGRTSFPLAKSDGANDVDIVMSNRRFLKVMDECRLLPKRKAAELIRANLADASAAHKRLFEQRVNARRGSYAKDKTPVGIAFPISNRPDGKPTLRGSRFKIFALLLVAGDLRLDGEQMMMDDVVNVAVQQYRELWEMSKQDQLDEFSSHGLVALASLYNRQILATAGPNPKCGYAAAL